VIGTATMAETLRALADVPATSTAEAMERAAEFARRVDVLRAEIEKTGPAELVLRGLAVGVVCATSRAELIARVAAAEVEAELRPKWAAEDARERGAW
jgi:hypothetical protein